MAPPLEYIGLPVPTGGVNVFFVLSAFIIGSCCRQESATAFFTRRAIRVVPMYWVMTLLTFALLSIAPRLFHSASGNYSDLARSMLFIPFDKGGSPLPVLPVGWTLNCEVAFYVLFGLCMVFARNPSRMALYLLCGIAAAAPFAAGLVPYYTSGAALCFALGLLVAQAPRVNLPAYCRVAWLPLAAVALFATGFLSAFASAALVWLLVQIERDGIFTRFGARIGDASYSIYLTHIFVTHAALIGYRVLGEAYAPLCLALGGAVSIGAGMIAYRFVEAPMTRRAHQYGTRWLLARTKCEAPPPPSWSLSEAVAASKV